MLRFYHGFTLESLLALKRHIFWGMFEHITEIRAAERIHNIEDHHAEPKKLLESLQWEVRGFKPVKIPDKIKEALESQGVAMERPEALGSEPAHD